MSVPHTSARLEMVLQATLRLWSSSTWQPSNHSYFLADHSNNLAGSLALVFLVLILLSSMQSVRRHCFQVRASSFKPYLMRLPEYMLCVPRRYCLRLFFAPCSVLASNWLWRGEGMKAHLQWLALAAVHPLPHCGLHWLYRVHLHTLLATVVVPDPR